jgi:hypothetical protein
MSTAGNILPTETASEPSSLASSLRQHALVVGDDDTTTAGTSAAQTATKGPATTANTNSSTAVATKPNPWVSLFHSFHLMIHMIWLQVALRWGRFYVSFVGGNISNFNRKVVVIGDEAALGVGDWVTMGSYPGIQRRLNDAINKDVMRRPVGRGIFWNAYDGGRSTSSTADWLPSGEVTKEIAQLKRKWRLVGTRNLFDSLFDPNVGEHRDADVVIILLGQHDRCDPVDTKRNLIKIAVELLKRNKYVIVCTCPNYPYLLGVRDGQPASPNSSKLHAEHRARNAAIREVVPHILEHVLVDAKDRKGMIELVDLVLRPLPYNYFRFNGRFLSGRGYDEVTTDILTALTPMMRRVDQDKAVLKVSPTYSHFR